MLSAVIALLHEDAVSCVQGGLRGRALLMLVAGLAAAPGAFAAGSSSADCAPALIVDQWRPFVSLVGDPAPDAALSRLDAVIGLERLVIGHTEPDARAESLRSALWNGVRDFDLGALYKAMPVVMPPWRAAYFMSRPAGAIYRISVAETPNASLNRLGASESVLAARPSGGDDQADGYVLRATMDANTGPIGWSGTRAAVAGGLLRTSAPARLSAPSSAQQAAHEAFAELDKNDRPLMAQLWYGLPATWAWYAGIGRIESLRAPAGAAPAAPGLHHLHYVAALSDQELSRDYPAVADYLKQLGDLVEARTVITSPAGQWLSFSMDSGARQIVIDAWVDDQGHLVPSRQGMPRPEAALTDDIASAGFDMTTEAHMHAYGLTVALSDMRVHWRMQADAGGAEFDGRLNSLPDMKISGRAFGIVPAGVLDALMPGDMTVFADRFMKRLIQTDDGRGAHLKLTLSDNRDDNRLHIAAKGDLLDNFFVRFGVKMMNGRVLPDAEQLAGIRRLLGDGLARFAADRDRRAGMNDVPAACRLR